MSGITVTRDKYDEPRCERCGHGPGVHTTTSCANNYRTLDGAHEATCDCAGWKRDQSWPPPIVIRESVA